MARNGMKVMDSDMHVIEPTDLWQRYMAPKYRAQAPRDVSGHPRAQQMELAGKLLPIPAPSPQQLNHLISLGKVQQSVYDAPEARGYDPASQIWAMDKEGLDVAVLFPSRGLVILGIDDMDPGLAAALAAAYNDWMRDFCKESPSRMYGAGLIALHDIPSAVEEATRVAKMGFRAIILRPNHVHGRQWSDPAYDPLWARCQDLGLAIGFHEGGRVYLPQPALKDLIPTKTMFSSLSFPMANMLSCADVILGGLLDRFPKLHIAFLEGNCSWIPWFLWRIGEYLENIGKFEYPNIKLSPMDYFTRQCYGAIECDEFTAKYIAEFGLQNNIVYSTDYPHTDAKFPDSVKSFLSLPLPAEAKRKILWDNCARLYKF